MQGETLFCHLTKKMRGIREEFRSINHTWEIWIPLRVSKNQEIGLGYQMGRAPDTGDGSHSLSGKMSLTTELNPPAGISKGTKEPLDPDSLHRETSPYGDALLPTESLGETLVSGKPHRRRSQLWR